LVCSLLKQSVMFKRILIVLEDEQVNSRAVYYACELAQRMDAEVSFLMLVRMEFLKWGQMGVNRSIMTELEGRVANQMAALSADFIRAGITTSTALRVGEPQRELFKFLTERPPFQLLIWGSHEDLPAGHSRRHWMAKAATSLECPLWTVSSRKPDD
jgi:nucleotide-binding universal stress UspA family protein